MTEEKEDENAAFLCGDSSYMVLRSDPFYLSIDLDHHRPPSERQDLIRIQISKISGDPLDKKGEHKALEFIKRALEINIGKGIASKTVYCDQAMCTDLNVELDADPQTVDRRALYDAVKAGFETACHKYDQHVAQRPERQRDAILKILEEFNGRTVDDARGKIADALVKKLTRKRQAIIELGDPKELREAREPGEPREPRQPGEPREPGEARRARG